MGLSEEYKKRIKESLDAEEGGRLRAIANKASAVNAPVLIIGLGGTGLDSLLITKKLIYETIKSEDRGGEYSDKPKNIEYMGIDTDESYKNKNYQGIYLNENLGEVNIFTMPNVQPVLAHPELLPPYVNSWLNTNIDTRTVINGAGAVRQLGRLLLMQNLNQVQSILQSKIAKVTNGYNTNTPLYVFILAGISGGTGSGTFIDIPYLVKAVSASHDNRPVQNIGVLFMPDVNANKNGIDNSKRENIYANGYAALKELDYLMNIEQVGDSFRQNYGTLQVGIQGELPISPYDICLLMSSKDKSGASRGTGDDNYNEVIHVAAETIFNFVLGDDGATDFNGFSIQSFLSNETSNINTYKTQLGDLKHPVSYVYSIAGASSAKLPLDDIMSYLTYKAFQEVDKYWNQRPEKADVDAVEAFFQLNKKAIEASAKAHTTKVDTSRIDFAACKERPAQVVQMYDSTLEKNRKIIAKNIEGMLENLEKMLQKEDNLINQYFLDLKKGPVFAQQCLYTTAAEAHCVMGDLSRLSVELRTESVTEEQLEVLQNNTTIALNQLRTSNHIFSGGKTKERDNYIEEMDHYYDTYFRRVLNLQMAEFCETAIGIIREKNNKIYDIIAELMETLVKIFEKYGNIKTSAVQTHSATGTTLSWYMVDTPAFIQELEKRMQTNPEFSVNLQEVVQNFYTYLFENTELWTGERRADVVENINGFIYRQFNKILDHSMDFFLAIIADSQNCTIQAYCDDIITTLTSKAEVRFPIDHAFTAGAVVQPSYSFISVPNNSPQLYNAAMTAGARAVTAGGASSIVKKSGIKDRIFMMNFMSATSLSLYADLKEFYRKYTAHREKPGIHLYEPTAYSHVDWKNLPSPYPETEWVAFQDDKEHEINEGYRKVLQKAIDYGYVVEDPMNRKMVLRWGDKVDWQGIANEFKIVLFENSAISSKPAKRALRKLKDALDDLEGRCKNSQERTEMIQDTIAGDGSLKKNYEEMKFIQMFLVRDYVKDMVENHEKTLAVIKDIRSRMIDDSIVEDYTICRITGAIKKNKMDYIYLDRKGAAQLLTSLSGQQAKFGEHYLLEAFTGLEDRIRTELVNSANTAIRGADGEELAQIVKKWENYRQKMIREPLDDLNYDWRDMSDGEMLLNTYQMLKEAADNVGNILGSSSSEDEDEF